MKKAYKQLQKKLKNKFKKTLITNEYSLIEGIKDWLKICNIKPSQKHIKIICKIFDDSVPYPYQESHRLKTLEYLKNHKYKQFKKL